MKQPICQSCAMPMKPEDYGTNKDETPNQEYCRYCYEKGAFTKDETMEEMIETCVPFMATPDSGMNEKQARAYLQDTLSKLKRWA